MNEQQIKDSLKEQINKAYKEYVTKVERYVNALKALGEEVPINSPFSKPVKIVRTIKFGSPSTTMKQKIIRVLQEAGKPLTSRQIMDAINEKFPSRIYDFDSFSGNFSQTWAKAGLKKLVRPDQPIESRVHYGLSNWFAGTNLLKQEYKDLI